MKHQTIISQMSLAEKCYLLSGKDFWQSSVKRLGIPSMALSDGPHGLRKQEGASDQLGLNGSVPATCYPTAATIANSWDPRLGEEIGRYLGNEAAEQEVAVLPPGMNIKRSPLCGRNFEYFSEDPFLTKEMAVPYIQGVQNWDVAACVKHFAVNNQETQRLWVDVKIDEKALREIYLPAFYDAVKKGGSYTIMGAYNRLYGEHCCQSDFLLNQVLRKEWDYDGVVISDWGGVHDTAEAAKSQLDIEMSVTSDFDQYFMAEPLRKLIEEREEPTTVQSADGGHTREETAEEERRMPGKTVDEEEHRILAKNAEEDSQTQGNRWMRKSAGFWRKLWMKKWCAS